MKKNKKVTHLTKLAKWVNDRPAGEQPHVNQVFEEMRTLPQKTFWDWFLRPRYSRTELLSARLASLEQLVLGLHHSFERIGAFSMVGYEEMRLRLAGGEETERELRSLLSRTEEDVRRLRELADTNAAGREYYKKESEGKDAEFEERLVEIAKQLEEEARIRQFGQAVIDAQLLYNFKALLDELPGAEAISTGKLSQLIEQQREFERLLPDGASTSRKRLESFLPGGSDAGIDIDPSVFEGLQSLSFFEEEEEAVSGEKMVRA